MRLINAGASNEYPQLIFLWINKKKIFQNYHKDSQPRWRSRTRAQMVIRRLRIQSQPSPATFFHGDWSWNIFYGHSLPSPVSVWHKNEHKYWCSHRGLRLSRKKCVLGCTLIALSVTLIGSLGRKISTQTKSPNTPLIYGKYGYKANMTHDDDYFIKSVKGSLLRK